MFYAQLDPIGPVDPVDPADLPEVSQEDAEKLVDEPVLEPPSEPIQDPEPPEVITATPATS